jgi:DNA-3-methyladenine glycosylase II
MPYRDAQQMRVGRAWLAARDPALARIDAAVGEIAWRVRPGGFEGLARLIIEQQISTAAAAAIRARVEAALGAVTPAAVLTRSEAELRGLGLSASKARYVQALARTWIGSGFDAGTLGALDDEAAVLALTGLPGIGRWTAEVFLLFCEGRPDIFPAGDLALQEGLRMADGAAIRPDARALARRAEAWRPHRGLAAHLIWAYYAAARAARSAERLEPAR